MVQIFGILLQFYCRPDFGNSVTVLLQFRFSPTNDAASTLRQVTATSVRHSAVGSRGQVPLNIHVVDMFL